MNDAIARQVKKLKCGDKTAFDELYKAYVGKLYRMAFMITNNKSDSEDIVQETFVKCFLHRESIRDETAFESWLCQILVRTAWRYRKKQKPDYSLEELTGTDMESGLGERLMLDEQAVQPLEEVLKKEENLRVKEAVMRLNMKQRTVIVLYYFCELPVEEIARITGSFPGTVKSRLFQARKSLRKMLEDKQHHSQKTMGSTGHKEILGIF